MAGSPSFAKMRKGNASYLISLIRACPGISRAELAKQAKLSKAAVSDIVDELLEENFVWESGSKNSTGGRPAIGLVFNKTINVVLGISLDETSVSCCCLDLDGQPFSETRKLLPKNWRAEFVEKMLIAEIQSIHKKFTGSSKISSAGFALPGPLTKQNSHVDLSKSGKYGEVIQKIRAYLKVPVEIESNVNAAAIAETALNKISEEEIAFVIRLGHKVRSALVVGGEILGGDSGMVGEFGHIRVPGNKILCDCGETGCINMNASLPALTEKCVEAGLAAQTPDDLVVIARRGNKKALKIMQEAIDSLAYGIDIVMKLMCPHAIILCGPGILVEEVISASEGLSQRASASKSNYRLVTSKAIDKAESLGAGLLALKNSAPVLAS